MTYPEGTDVRPVVEAESVDIYGPRVLPTQLDTGRVDGQHGAVLDFVEWFATPIRVAEITLSLWVPEGLATSPHELRIGDVVVVDIELIRPRLAGVIVGRRLDLNQGRDPRVHLTVLEAYSAPVPTPAVPTVAAAGVGEATITWVLLADDVVTGYEARWQLDGGVWTVVPEVGPMVVSVTVRVPGAGQFGAQVRAVSGSQRGQWSATSVTVAVLAPPAPPRLSQPMAMSDDPEEATVSWVESTSDYTTHYRIRYREDSGAWMVLADEIAVGTVEHTLVGLTGGVSFEAQVQAVAGTVEGLWSLSSVAVTIRVAWAPGDAVDRGDLPVLLTSPRGITYDGTQLVIVHSGTDGELWTLGSVSNPSGAVYQGDLPSELSDPRGITHDGTQYVIVHPGTDGELWTLDDVTEPGDAVYQGAFPSGLTFPQGITWDGTQLIIVDNTNTVDQLWTLADATAPGDAVLRGALPSGLSDPQSITSVGALLVIGNSHPNGTDELWTLDDVTQPGAAVNRGQLPSVPPARLRGAWGMAYDSDSDLLVIVDGTGAVWTLPPPPTAPPVVATVPDRGAAPSVSLADDQITVTWVGPYDGGDPISGYTLEQDHDGTLTTSLQAGLTTTITATSDGDYSYRFLATNSIGDGLYSPQSATVTYTAPASLAVTSVQAVSVGETTVTIRVNVANADGSSVHARYSDDATFPIGSTTNRSATIQAGDSSHDFAVTGLTDDTLYYVEASYDNTYPDAETEETTFTTEAAATVPSRPAAPTVSLVGDQMTVTWVEPDDGGDPITSYQLQQDLDGTRTNTIHTGLTTTFAVTVDGDYRYRVRAINGVGNSVRSLFSATVTYTAASAPEVTSVTVGTVGETSATITVNVSDADGSTVYARYSDDQTFPAASTTDLEDTIQSGDSDATFGATGLDADTLYYVEASYDNTYPDAETEDTTFTTEALAPDVTSVQAVSVGETTVTIRVNVVNADGSVVSARYSDDATFPIGSTTNRASTIQAGNSSHDFAVVGLDPATVYYVEASYNFAYPAAETEETTFTTEAVTPLVWDPTNAVNRGSFPSGLTLPLGITHDGTQLIVVDSIGDELWTVADVASPGDAVLRGSFPSGLTNPAGITHDGTQLFVVDADGDELWTVGDLTDPGNTTTTVLLGTFPSELGTPRGITHDGTQLIVVDADGDALWTLGDATDPGTAVNRGTFPSGLTSPLGITHDGTQLIVVDADGDELWTVGDLTQPGNTTTTVNRGDFPSGVTDPQGITHDGTQLVVVDSGNPDELWTLAPD